MCIELGPGRLDGATIKRAIYVNMVGTKGGATNSEWVKHLKKCATDYHKYQKGMPPTSKAGQTKAQPTIEVNNEERKEKAAATRENKATTKKWHDETRAVEKEKRATTPAKATAKQRLKATTKPIHADAVARAHRTIMERRKAAQE